MTNEEAQQKLQQIMDLCEDLGWDVLIGRNEETNEVEGLISGLDEYLDVIVDRLSKDGESPASIPQKKKEPDPSFH